MKNYLLVTTTFIIITLLAWLLRDTLTLANFTMIYLLLVLVIAIRLGTAAAMSVAVAGFLCINFFLTHPYYTFIVADPREVLDLIVFMLVSVLSGQLGARARRQTAEAKRRAYEQEILYRLTGSMNQITDKEAVYDVLTGLMQQDLHARQAFVLPGEIDQQSNDQTVYFLLLEAGDQIYGTLCVTFDAVLTSQQIQLVYACAGQAAMALQRIELAQRARASQQYEEADRLKTAILRAVSHDLRTPITIMKTSASNLRSFGENLSLAERLDLYETIETESDHLNKLIGNLLDLSRLQAGAMMLNSELNSLEEVAGDVAARVWQTVGSERIRVSFPDDLPLVMFDYGLILQALTNLVDNALRYEPAGSRIEIVGYVTEHEACVKVINHGENIPLEERDHVMEAFYHGKDGHIGLGLPIARGIIETHHGKLWVEDTPGGGATFVLTLPVDREEMIEHEAEDIGGGRRATNT